jgi:hypothetical protein
MCTAEWQCTVGYIRNQFPTSDFDHKTESRSRVVSTPALYSGGPEF